MVHWINNIKIHLIWDTFEHWIVFSVFRTSKLPWRESHNLRLHSPDVELWSLWVLDTKSFSASWVLARSVGKLWCLKKWLFCITIWFICFIKRTTKKIAYSFLGWKNLSRKEFIFGRDQQWQGHQERDVSYHTILFNLM